MFVKDGEGAIDRGNLDSLKHQEGKIRTVVYSITTFAYVLWNPFDFLGMKFCRFFQNDILGCTSIHRI